MNSFYKLPEEVVDPEIKSDNQLRNAKKKLKKKEIKLEKEYSLELESEIKKLTTLIEEYENKDKPPTIHKKGKNKQPQKNDFDDEEITSFNRKRKREFQEEQERKKQQKEKEKEESDRKWKEYHDKYGRSDKSLVEIPTIKYIIDSTSTMVVILGMTII